MVVELHARLRVDVLGADDLTVPLQSFQLEELGRRQELFGDEQRVSGKAVIPTLGGTHPPQYLAVFKM